MTISSAGNSYTLASSTSPLVLTVQNSLPYNVPVRVRITGGERVGLTVTDPGVQVIPAGRSLQVKIPAEVTRSGQFQVGAQLLAPDGTAWSDPVQLSVESSAYGAVTVIIIIVAGGVLLVMVILRITQRLRNRRARLAGNARATARHADGPARRRVKDQDRLRFRPGPGPDDDESGSAPTGRRRSLARHTGSATTTGSTDPVSAPVSHGNKLAAVSVTNADVSGPSAQAGLGGSPDAGHRGTERS